MRSLRKNGKLSERARRENLSAYLMLSPFLLFFLLFVLYPVAKNLYYSFTDFHFGSEYSFAGMKNYRELFRDRWFLVSLKNTAVYALFSVIFLTFLGLAVSVMLNRRSRLVKASRTALIFPYATSMVAVSLLWLFLLDPSTGYINKILAALGVSSPPYWLDNPKYALPSLIFINVWKNLGYVLIIYLAGLSAIPNELYEAATVDGASTLQKHLKITLPQIAPVTFFVFVTNCIEAFKTFEQINIMTQGGPMTSTSTVVYQIYMRAFNDFRMGYAAAMSVILFLIIFSVTLVNFFMFKKRSEEGAA